MKNKETKIGDYQSYPVYIISRYTAILALLGHLLFLILFMILKIRPLVYVNIVSCLIFIAAIVFNRLRFHKTVLNLTLMEIIAHAFFTTYYLGWASGFYIYIFCLIPLVFMYRIISHFWRNILFISLLACLLILHLNSRIWPAIHGMPPNTLANLTLMNLIIAFSVFLILSAAYSLSAMDLEHQLRLNNEKLEATSRKDPLTSLSNRRDVLELIKIEKEKMLRNKSCCCFIVSDLDNFKVINDSYGHDYGDSILKQISDILRSSLRKQDHVCRWGGEEFLIVLPDTELEGAGDAAEKLRKRIDSFDFCFQEINTHITMTFGVALYDPQKDENVSIKKADELLYIGKEKGRNRVEVQESS